MLFVMLNLCVQIFATQNDPAHFWGGDTLNVKEIESVWPTQTNFKYDKFKSATTAERATMISSLIKQKNLWSGKSIDEIRKDLGDWNGFYFQDHIPAYRIGSREKQNGNSYQIVFIPNKNKRVEAVIIHKLCCYTESKGN